MAKADDTSLAAVLGSTNAISIDTDSPITVICVIHFTMTVYTAGVHSSVPGRIEAIHPQYLPGLKRAYTSTASSTTTNMSSFEISLHIQKRNLDWERRILGEEHPDTLRSMNNFGVALFNQQQYRAAEEMLEKTLTLQKRILGVEHPDTLRTMNNVGGVLNNKQQYKAAEETHEEALALRICVLGKEHPDTLASMNNLGATLFNQKQYRPAEEMHRETFALRKRVLGEEHIDTLTSMNNLTMAEKARWREVRSVPRVWKSRGAVLKWCASLAVWRKKRQDKSLTPQSSVPPLSDDAPPSYISLPPAYTATESKDTEGT